MKTRNVTKGQELKTSSPCFGDFVASIGISSELSGNRRLKVLSFQSFSLYIHTSF